MRRDAMGYDDYEPWLDSYGAMNMRQLNHMYAVPKGT